MPRTYPDVEVTNTGQPQVVAIDPVSRTQVPSDLRIQLDANQTVEISPVSN